MAHGNSNKIISDSLDIPLKTVERILNELNKKFHNKSKLYNPRLRLLLSCIAKDILDYEAVSGSYEFKKLNPNLNKTLILSCIGFSNKAIANFFGLSEKAIELRFSQLFDYFNIDTKNQSFENPRVLLFINAYLRKNITKTQLQRLYKESHNERLEAIVTNPKLLLDSLEEVHKFIG
jgi:hypothetical protein